MLFQMLPVFLTVVAFVGIDGCVFGYTFQQTAQAMIAKHIDRFPLLKSEGDVFEPVESG